VEAKIANSGELYLHPAYNGRAHWRVISRKRVVKPGRKKPMAALFRLALKQVKCLSIIAKKHNYFLTMLATVKRKRGRPVLKDPGVVTAYLINHKQGT
jgi:hypothetical protein